VRPSAVGHVWSRSPLPFGWGLFRCLCLLMVWLENFSARSRYAFRQPNRPNVRGREYLFSSRQVILFRRAGSCRLGNRSHRRPSRLKAVWLTVGLVLIAWMGATSRIHASRTAVPGGLGQISMNFFTLGASGQAISDGLLHALVILTLT